MKNNLLNSLLSKAKKSELDGGIHENCILTAVSNETRKSKSGDKITKNGYTTFGKLNDKGEVVAEKEIGWWDIDHNSDYAGSNLFEQLGQMVNVLDCFYDEEKINKKFDELFEEEEIENKDDLEKAASKKSSLKTLIDGMNEIYVSMLQAKIDDEDKTPLRVKLVYDSKGRNVQVPSYSNFVELNSVEETTLSMSKRELEFEAKSKITAMPGASKTGKSPKKVTSI